MESQMTINRRRSGLALLALAARKPPPPDDDDDAPNLPNTFFSPAGKPFRAPAGDPYPVVDWFKEADKNGDGKIDHAEFLADAEAFFNLLDINKDGYLSRYEIAIYEQKIAPEILVGTAHIGLGPGGDGTGRGGARLLLAQGGVQRPGPIDPGGDNQEVPSGKPPVLDESGQGASPYGFFEEPEPVMSADLNVLKTADMHFDALDQKKLGYLTLATLPKTPIQRALEHARKGRKKA
jgi:hypothetical protein